MKRFTYSAVPIVRILALAIASTALIGISSFVIARGLQAKASQKTPSTDQFQAYIKSLAAERGKFPWPGEGNDDQLWQPPTWGQSNLAWDTVIFFQAGVADKMLTLSYNGPPPPKGKHAAYGSLYCAGIKNGKAVRLWYIKVVHVSKWTKSHEKAPDGTLAAWLWNNDMIVPSYASKTIKATLHKVTPYAYFTISEIGPFASSLYCEESGLSAGDTTQSATDANYGLLDLDDLFSGKPIPILEPEIEYLKKKFMENQGK